MAGPGFAIIDFETTGLFPAHHDRVIEVAIVHTDRTGRVTGTWDTLVNPGRDLGKQSIHHIAAADVLRAPTFEQIAPRLVELLSGRVLVAHNASFDTRFLIAELTRAGYVLGGPPDSLCTMRLAREFLPGSGRSLADCCAALDIEIGDAHRASADALATAKVLRHYIEAYPDETYWHDVVDRAAGRDWPPMAILDAEWMTREVAEVPGPTFLQRITERMPDHSGPYEHSEYLALLDRVLLDRVISHHELEQLVALAGDLGIGRSQCETLNRTYFDALVQVAWEDGVLTADELQDLGTVAALLQVDPAALEAATQDPPPNSKRIATPARPVLQPGELVVLTGDMRRPRDEWEQELTALGYRPWGAVTKKVRLVVAADPDSLSGKAKKARDYGIPIVNEKALERFVSAARAEIVR